jgi:hypothetical protein
VQQTLSKNTSTDYGQVLAPSSLLARDAVSRGPPGIGPLPTWPARPADGRPNVIETQHHVIFDLSVYLSDQQLSDEIFAQTISRQVRSSTLSSGFWLTHPHFHGSVRPSHQMSRRTWCDHGRRYSLITRTDCVATNAVTNVDLWEWRRSSRFHSFNVPIYVARSDHSLIISVWIRFTFFYQSSSIWPLVVTRNLILPPIGSKTRGNKHL